MRGSIYYQSAQLAKAVFQAGAKKDERMNPEHDYFEKVSSYRTMEAYRDIWNNIFKYVKGTFNISDMNEIYPQHIEAYMEWKIQCGVSKQYLEQISSAIGKLAIARQHLNKQSGEKPLSLANLSIRQEVLDLAREYDRVKDGYHDRAYKDPEAIIKKLPYDFALASSIALESGARLEAVTLIKDPQIIGPRVADFGKKHIMAIETKEKGGKVGEVYCTLETGKKLKKYMVKHREFKVDRDKLLGAIRKACKELGVESEGMHGFRWTFAKRRYLEYQRAGYTTEQTLQAVSSEMKHNRASITKHYLNAKSNSAA